MHVYELQTACHLCEPGRMLAEVVDLPTLTVPNPAMGVTEIMRYDGPQKVTIYCSDCLVVFKHLPGKPDTVRDVLSHHNDPVIAQERIMSRLAGSRRSPAG